MVVGVEKDVNKKPKRGLLLSVSREEGLLMKESSLL